MKKLLLLSMLLLTVAFTGCDDDDDNETTPTIDLAAQPIDVSVNKTSSTEGTIIIRGTVKNIGADFISGEDQQLVTLTEKHPGGQPTTVAEKEFSRLNAGETIEVKFSTQWRTSMEFPPEYTLRITYGPDIYIDGNEQNDDENADNNSKTITGVEINEMF